MMVVVAIMMILVVAGAARMQMSKDSRRAREAARMINVYLSSARNRAMETGRPCGVVFRVMTVGTTSNPAAPCSMNADQCEVPPCYCGQAENSMAIVNGGIVSTPAGGTTSGCTVSLANSSEAWPSSTISPGDWIQFNGQGPLYAFAATNSTDSYGYIAGNNSNPLTVTFADTVTGVSRIMPWTTIAGTVPFRIFPAPMRNAASPLQLPAGSVVDLNWSGVGTTYVGQRDFTVLFSPNGSVDRIYYNASTSPATDTIYLLIGKRERVGLNPPYQSSPTTANESSWGNFQDMENALWITINPQTGLVNSEPVGSTSGGVPTDPIAARGLAAQAQGKGGQ
jgi:type II secretory pathway pseudopilin PulG